MTLLETAKISALRNILPLCLLALIFTGSAHAAGREAWAAKLDSPVRFYQTMELGVIVAGTEKSLYAIDNASGEILWRRKNARLDETDVAAIPGTDLVLLSFEKKDRTRLEAVDALTGEAIWRTEKVRGSIMQLALDLQSNLLAAVLVRDAKGSPREGFKRKPVAHVFDLATGEERWKRELQTEIEMMPSRFVNKEGDKTNEEIPYTLDNYHPPLFLDGRLYLFYEGFTSYDAPTGKDRVRERFRVNEEDLALTEADPVFDEGFIYASGRGKVRAFSRETGEALWEAKDLGVTPELILAGNILYARTGGQFTRLRDGETIERGPYGVSAIDAHTGKTLWRYKGADKGITNLALPDASTVALADRDDLIFLDAQTGKRRAKISHNIESAAFVLINERTEAIVGGRNELAAFKEENNRSLWRARHTPPARGLLRITLAVAARAASLYFRYGGVASTAFRGAQLAQAAAGTLRWSGLSAARASLPNLQSLATGAAREQITPRFNAYGTLARLRQTAQTLSVPDSIPTAAAVRSRVVTEATRRAAEASRNAAVNAVPSSTDIEDRLLDRLDPAQQLDRLSAYLLRRRRLAALRGTFMYFYTDLQTGGRGLAGVNLNTGRTERAIRIGDPDAFFIVDETINLLYTANGNRLFAYGVEGTF
ncbi:MAG: PQQ-binding-like beta-propeller repeat protein [Pyrinomonadaceae bacterium]